jgi:hypothetical protein
VRATRVEASPSWERPTEPVGEVESQELQDGQEMSHGTCSYRHAWASRLTLDKGTGPFACRCELHERGPVPHSSSPGDLVGVNNHEGLGNEPWTTYPPAVRSPIPTTFEEVVFHLGPDAVDNMFLIHTLQPAGQRRQGSPS